MSPQISIPDGTLQIYSHGNVVFANPSQSARRNYFRSTWKVTSNSEVVATGSNAFVSFPVEQLGDPPIELTYYEGDDNAFDNIVKGKELLSVDITAQVEAATDIRLFGKDLSGLNIDELVDHYDVDDDETLERSEWAPITDDYRRERISNDQYYALIGRLLGNLEG